jgi:hypothetical protein
VVAVLGRGVHHARRLRLQEVVVVAPLRRVDHTPPAHGHGLESARQGARRQRRFATVVVQPACAAARQAAADGPVGRAAVPRVFLTSDRQGLGRRRRRTGGGTGSSGVGSGDGGVARLGDGLGRSRGGACSCGRFGAKPDRLMAADAAVERKGPGSGVRVEEGPVHQSVVDTPTRVHVTGVVLLEG